jgi:HAD superfamily hydrolase (TIGR01662 family)
MLGRKDILKTGGLIDVPKRLIGSLKMLGCEKNCINGSRKIMEKIPGSRTQIVGPGVHAIVTTPSGARVHYGKGKDGTMGFRRLPEVFQPRWQMGEKLEDLRLGVRKKACYDPSLMTVNSAPEATPPSPGILFDIDGTLVDEVNGDIIPGVLNKLLDLHARGVKMAAVTNRSVYDSEGTVDDVFDGVAEILTLCGGTLRDGYFVSHGPSPLHKPSPDMLVFAMQRECIDPANCLYVGNCDTDAEAAEAAGIAYLDHLAFFGA